MTLHCCYENYNNLILEIKKALAPISSALSVYDFLI